MCERTLVSSQSWPPQSLYLREGQLFFVDTIIQVRKIEAFFCASHEMKELISQDV